MMLLSKIRVPKNLVGAFQPAKNGSAFDVAFKKKIGLIGLS